MLHIFSFLFVFCNGFMQELIIYFTMHTGYAIYMYIVWQLYNKSNNVLDCNFLFSNYIDTHKSSTPKPVINKSINGMDTTGQLLISGRVQRSTREKRKHSRININNGEKFYIILISFLVYQFFLLSTLFILFLTMK